MRWSPFVALVLLAALSCKKPEPPPPPVVVEAKDAAPPPPPFVCQEPPATDARILLASPGTRAKIGALARGMIVAVKYAPCEELVVVDDCTIPGGYRYEPAPSAPSSVKLDDAETLETQTFGGGALAKLDPTTSMLLEGALAGHAYAVPTTETRAALDACATATHFVSTFDRGALRKTKIVDGQIETVGGIDLCPKPEAADAGRATAKKDAGPPAPPVNCDAVVRIELTPRADAERRLASLAEAAKKSGKKPEAQVSSAQAAKLAAEAEAMQMQMLGAFAGSNGAKGVLSNGDVPPVDLSKAASGSGGVSNANPKPTGTSKPAGKAPQAEILAPPQ